MLGLTEAIEAVIRPEHDLVEPLIAAIVHCHVDIVKLLISRGADVNAICAIRNIKLAMDSCGDCHRTDRSFYTSKYTYEWHINGCYKDGSYPIIVAVRYSTPEIVGILLDSGAKHVYESNNDDCGCYIFENGKPFYKRTSFDDDDDDSFDDISTNTCFCVNHASHYNGSCICCACTTADVYKLLDSRGIACECKENRPDPVFRCLLSADYDYSHGITTAYDKVLLMAKKTDKVESYDGVLNNLTDAPLFVAQGLSEHIKNIQSKDLSNFWIKSENAEYIECYIQNGWRPSPSNIEHAIATKQYKLLELFIKKSDADSVEIIKKMLNPSTPSR